MTELNRRKALGALAATTAGVACTRNEGGKSETVSRGLAPAGASTAETKSPERTIRAEFDLPLGRPWKTPDPFLFCVHHNDRYPRGNGTYGPAASLEGRELGRDFAWKDGWNMYHGMAVPGFPAHPHRGFETVTVVRRGRLDHADSLGAAARYGDGDVQWLTAGRGIQHAEMFPLLKEGEENPLDLFQIWLNLPSRNKMVAPYFSMLWAETIPEKTITDPQGKRVKITTRAGKIAGITAPKPPPDSWAADPSHEVGIFTIAFQSGARWTLPAAGPGVSRHLYFFDGSSLSVQGRRLRSRRGVDLLGSVDVVLENSSKDPAEVLVLQGKPIGEPVAKNGPFVMNTQAEIRQAYDDYRATRFGGWPWEGSGPVHGSDPARFAKLVSGETEKPG